MRTEGNCPEDWDRMRPVAAGRYCAKCQHAVIDFTGWDRAAVLAYKRQHPDACGRYLAEHIEPDLIPLVDLLRPKRGILVAGLALGTIEVAAQRADTVRVEQHQAVDARSSGPVEPEVLSLFPISLPTMPKGLADADVRTKYDRRQRSRIYVSRRFPFVHVRRRYFMGKRILHL